MPPCYGYQVRGSSRSASPGEERGSPFVLRRPYKGSRTARSGRGVQMNAALARGIFLLRSTGLRAMFIADVSARKSKLLLIGAQSPAVMSSRRSSQWAELLARRISGGGNVDSKKKPERAASLGKVTKPLHVVLLHQRGEHQNSGGDDVVMPVLHYQHSQQAKYVNDPVPERAFTGSPPVLPSERSLASRTPPLMRRPSPPSRFVRRQASRFGGFDHPNRTFVVCSHFLSPLMGVGRRVQKQTTTMASSLCGSRVP